MTSSDRVEITQTEPSEDRINDMVSVVVTIGDFLYMYSGEASAADIAGLCMSGRIGVNWTQYNQLKAFADSFDFSTEMWERFYRETREIPVDQQNIHCKSNCFCQQTRTQEEEDAKWQLICQHVLTSSNRKILEPEWEFVGNSGEQIIAFQPVDSRREPPSKLELITDTMKKKMSSLREYAEKFLLDDLG